jgi:acyl phosphate:glycerol-3-phosphate acyltransferase
LLDNYYYYLVIPLGYLLGSIPGSILVSKLSKKYDIRSEKDGKVSAAALYRNLGIVPFFVAVNFDVLKGILAITIARFLTQNNPFSLEIMLATGLAAVAAHNWSPFLKFKGGLGATVTLGVLGAIAPYQTLLSFVPGLLFASITRKTGLATAIIVISLPAIFLIQKLTGWQLPPSDPPVYLILYPFVIILLMVFKKWQVNRSAS